MNSSIIEIGKILTTNNKEVLEELTFCVAETKKYYEEHIEDFEERGIDEFDEEEKSQFIWLGMVDILERNGYVCERDVNDELEDFLYFVRELNGVKENGLTIEEDEFDEDGYIGDWSEIVDEKWEKDGFCLASIDIESDCYVLFPAQVSELEVLDGLAHEAGYRIDRAAVM